MTTVVVLTHDRPRQLTACVRSLLAQETTEPFDIVIADDGSGPRTLAAIDALRRADPRVRHVRHDHRGIAATRNLGVSNACGEFVAIVADDYVLSPHYLSEALTYLRTHPAAGVVRFHVRPLRPTWGARVSDCYYAAATYGRLESEGLRLAEAGGGVATRTLEAVGGAVFRAAVLDEVGPWDERLGRGEDTEHTSRIREHGHQVHLLATDLVRTDYRSIPVDTLRKCVLHGFWRDRIARRTTPRRWRTRLRLVHRARDRVRWLPTRRERVVALPWMLLFEVAAFGGECWSMVTLRRRAR